MKALLTPLFIALLLLGVTSCESEYDRQLQLGKELIQEELQLNRLISDRLELNESAEKLLENVKSDLSFHAHMSGNEEVFVQELASFKQDLANEDFYQTASK